MHSVKPKSASVKPRLLSLYDGTRCLGHLISRGPAGWEAYDVADRSIGTFPDQDAAADAVTAAHAQASDQGGSA
jgi:hypothetical protein